MVPVLVTLTLTLLFFPPSWSWSSAELALSQIWSKVGISILSTAWYWSVVCSACIWNLTHCLPATKGNSLKEEWTAYICREILRVRKYFPSFIDLGIPPKLNVNNLADVMLSMDALWEFCGQFGQIGFGWCHVLLHNNAWHSSKAEYSISMVILLCSGFWLLWWSWCTGFELCYTQLEFLMMCCNIKFRSILPQRANSGHAMSWLHSICCTVLFVTKSCKLFHRGKCNLRVNLYHLYWLCHLLFAGTCTSSLQESHSQRHKGAKCVAYR